MLLAFSGIAGLDKLEKNGWKYLSYGCYLKQYCCAKTDILEFAQSQYLSVIICVLTCFNLICAAYD